MSPTAYESSVAEAASEKSAVQGRIITGLTTAGGEDIAFDNTYTVVEDGMVRGTVHGEPYAIPLADVSTIRILGDENVKKGVVIGLAVGCVLAAMAAVIIAAYMDPPFGS